VRSFLVNVILFENVSQEKVINIEEEGLLVEEILLIKETITIMNLRLVLNINNKVE